MDGARYLEDGKLTIFRRWGTYYARIRTSASDKYIVRSLKTSDEQTAIRLGRRLLFQIEQRAEQGLPPKSKLFAAVIDDYIRFRERDHAHGKTSAGMLRQIVRVSRFWREYAGELAVDAIDDKVMREFIPWRRDYYSKFKKLPKNARLHPTDKTLQWDMMLGKAIVRWAHEQGLRGSQALPTVTFTPKKKRVRPAFELLEFRRLWRTMYKRINDAKDERTRRSRELLRDFGPDDPRVLWEAGDLSRVCNEAGRLSASRSPSGLRTKSQIVSYGYGYSCGCAFSIGRSNDLWSPPLGVPPEEHPSPSGLHFVHVLPLYWLSSPGDSDGQQIERNS